MRIRLHPCAQDHILPLSSVPLTGMASHMGPTPLPPLAVGTELLQEGQVLFRVVGRAFLPALNTPHALPCPLLKACAPLSQGEVELSTRKEGFTLAWVTLSDKGFLGQREDQSGPHMEELVTAHLPLCHAQGFLLPDEASALRTLLLELALGQGYDPICTSGGTGVGPRDTTPEATLSVLDKRLTGFEQAMMAASLQKTPRAVISRAVVGILGTSLCINLPGSLKAVHENLEAVLPALKHTLEKLRGDTADCGR